MLLDAPAAAAAVFTRWSTCKLPNDTKKPLEG
jgi:hypothetical protein